MDFNAICHECKMKIYAYPEFDEMICPECGRVSNARGRSTIFT